MANITQTPSRVTIHGFDGLSPSAPRNGGLPVCRNFRRLWDGSLEKREGFRLAAAIPDIRGAASVNDGDAQVLLAVTEDKLCRVDTGSGQISIATVLDRTTGEVGFLPIGGKTYLLDGGNFYRYDGGVSLTRVEGYTPLYGDGWMAFPSSDETVCEAPNPLCPRLRIRYRTGSGAVALSLRMPAESVVSVRLDGQEIDAEEYCLAEGNTELHFASPTGEADSVIEVVFVPVALPVSAADAAAFASAVRGEVFDDFRNTRIFLYGGSDASRIFLSAIPPEDRQALDKEEFPDSCGLYFPMSPPVRVGGGQSVTAIRRVRDRVAVFSPTGVCVSGKIDEDGGQTEFTPLYDRVGCSAPEAVTLTDAGKPITVTDGGIFRLDIDAEFRENCSLRRISDEIAVLPGAGFAAHASVAYHTRRGEIWFADTRSEDGNVFVYDTQTGFWSLFSGIPARRLFSHGDGIAFLNDSGLFFFDEEKKTDGYSVGERLIDAEFETGLLDFTDSEREKRLERLLLDAVSDGGVLEVRIADRGKLVETTVRATDQSGAPGWYSIHVPTGRFGGVTFGVRSRDAARPRIFGAELRVKK